MNRRVQNLVHTFKRTFYNSAGIIVPSGSGFSFNAWTFTLNQLPNVTDFTSLYDQYKINGIKFTLIPRHTEVPMNTSVGLQVMSVLDFDDDVAPTSINDLCQYGNMKQTRGNINHSRYFRPTIRKSVDVAGASPGYQVSKSEWLDLANTVVKHYGLKYAIEQGNVAVTYDLKIDMYFQCKNLH